MRSKLGKYRTPYLFIAPFFVLFAAFVLSPIVYSLWLSLQEVVGIYVPLQFVGLKNYLDLVSDPRFLHSLVVTFTYTFFQVTIMVVLAVILALILDQRTLRGRNVYRLVFFFPVITSFIVAAMVFKLLLDKEIGLFNMLLRAVHMRTHAWLEDPTYALPSLITIGIWRWVGYQMVILLAGLQNIPAELYDSARVDGAGSLRIVFRITLPLLFPVIFFVIVMSVIGSLQLFDEPFILNMHGGGAGSGGPADSMLSTAIYLYQTGFLDFRLGYASAVGYVLTVVILAISLLQILTFGKRAGFAEI